ncbi:MAG: hypothetical protein AAFQ87_23765, partial [Bacteroidota bacterium]
PMHRTKHLATIALALALFFTACEEFDQTNVELDNDSESTLIVKLDELSYRMNPGGYLAIQLEPGLHQITVTDQESDEELKSETFEVKNGGLINLGEAQYYIWADLYGNQALKAEKLNIQDLVIESKDEKGKKIKTTYTGDFQPLPTDQLYIESQWDYGLGEDWPSRLWDIVPKEDKFKVRRKLYREQGLIDYYMSRVPGAETEN